MDPPAADLIPAVPPSQLRQPHRQRQRQRGGRTSRQIEWALISTIIFSVITFLKFQSTVHKSVPAIKTQDQLRHVYDIGSSNKRASMYPLQTDHIMEKDIAGSIIGENQIMSHRKLEQIHHAHLDNLYHKKKKSGGATQVSEKKKKKRGRGAGGPRRDAGFP
eukprot:scaffold10884_cov77-Skeletonema_dohrnii-CCMP3373.AAC.2